MPDAKILVIDDEGSTRALLATELEKAGYSVFKADDGEVGLQVVRAANPDLIICDVLMPTMDGNQFLKKLREREYSRDIPVIIMSSRGQMKDYFMMMDVADFIAKPLKMDDVRARIERVLAKRKAAAPQAAAPAPESGGEAKQEPVIIRKKVLLLDDHETMTEKYGRLFKENLFDVKITKTIKECLDTALSFKPDVIGLRYLTNGAGREEPIVTIKDVPHVRHIPFVVYGEEIEESDREAILEAGVEIFVNGAAEDKLLQALKKMTK